MMRVKPIILALLMAAVGLLSAGCGGGTGTDVTTADPENKTTLSGTVYTSGPLPAAAGEAPGAQLLYDATVVVRRVVNNAYVTDTRTNSTGRYNIAGLDRGLDALLTCTSPTGEVLMTRALLDAREVTADIDEDTTLVTRCQLLMRANGGGETSPDVEVTVAQLCMQFQQQHRYEYGSLGGVRPDFTNEDAQWRAAAALLAAATDDAVNQARNSRTAQHCERAVNMVCARLQAEGLIDFDLDAATRAAIAQALRGGAGFSADDIAVALSAALDKAVTVADLDAIRGRIDWCCVRGRTGELDIVEATAAACASGGGDQNCLRSAAEVAAFVGALVG